MSFANSQESYFVRQINRALPTAPQLSVNPLSLDAALGNPDGGRVHLDSILTDAGGGAGAAAARQRDAACRALPYPGPGMRDPAARVGCGWWFTPDPSQHSTGAYGTRRGPMSPTLDTTAGSGQWIWDPREAQRMEGMKRMANIRSCPDIQYSTFPNVGWCPTTNMAILTDGAGNPLFPQSPGGDCPGGGIVTNVASCPPPPPPPSAAGGAGGAAAPTPTSTPGIRDICDPGAGGALSPQCLYALATWPDQTCSPKGTLAVALSNGYAGTDISFNDVNAMLSARGFQINSGIINDGKLSVSDAIGSVRGLRQVANSNDGSLLATAAANMCFDSTINLCNIPGSMTAPGGDWSQYAGCIQEAAIAKGYSPQAGLMPGIIGIAYWNQPQLNTWSAVLANLDWWMAKAYDQSDPKLQALALENVFGLNLNFPPPSCTPVGV
jgi:hypothetical protein